MCMSRCRPVPTAIGIVTSRCGTRIHRTHTMGIATEAVRYSRSFSRWMQVQARVGYFGYADTKKYVLTDHASSAGTFQRALSLQLALVRGYLGQ
jgi:hypothetical protein